MATKQNSILKQKQYHNKSELCTNLKVVVEKKYWSMLAVLTLEPF